MTRFLILLCFLPVKVYGQLVQFPDTANNWHVVATYPHGSPQDPAFIETATTRYYYIGDTLMDGSTWSTMMAWPFVGAGGDPEPIGYAREEGDLVLFKDTLNALDTLYNFSLQPGDSVFYPWPISSYLYVSGVHDETIAGEPHSVIEFEPFMGHVPNVLSERWIQGIGSIHGPLFPRYPKSFSTEVPADSLILSCFERSGALIWSHPDYPYCVVNIIMRAPDSKISSSMFNVRPNPGNDHVWIDGIDTDRAFDLVVYDLHGKVVLNRTLQSRNDFDTSAIEPGAYTIVLRTYKNTFVRLKWMKE